MADELYIDKNRNMLIIGRASSNFARKEIVYSEDYDEVLKKFGDSELTKAFKGAQDFGAPYIFLMNVQDNQDYLEIFDVIQQNDFSYIVFASLLLSDTFQNIKDGGQEHNFFAYILGSIGLNNDSTIIVTDKHASLYEDVDAFLKDMRKTVTTFEECCSERANLRNLIFVANNLKDHLMANVPLAATLCAKGITEYPTSNLYGKSIFRIDRWDCDFDMAYYRSEPTRETTIENLLNCEREWAPEKVVYIDRIMKYLKRGMAFEQFRGRMYTSYQKLLFNQALVKYLDAIKEKKIIKQYIIDSIETYKDVPGTVIMLARLKVQPANCLDLCSLSVEAKV